MVRLATSEEWQRQSSLLLQARPTTTRITTKYNVPNLDSPKYEETKKRKRDADAAEDEKNATRIPKATLTLKTYDPDSGVVLKFKTDRAAEVGRLIGGLGRLGRHMAALPEKLEDIAMDDAPPVEQTVETNETPAAAKETKPQPVAGGGGSGGGKKKKKGKK